MINKVRIIDTYEKFRDLKSVGDDLIVLKLVDRNILIYKNSDNLYVSDDLKTDHIVVLRRLSGIVQDKLGELNETSFINHPMVGVTEEDVINTINSFKNKNHYSVSPNEPDNVKKNSLYKRILIFVFWLLVFSGLLIWWLNK